MRREDVEIEKVFGVDEKISADQKFRDILYALNQSAIVAITDRTGKIIFVNDKFIEISQYSSEELIGQNHGLINSSYHTKDFFKTMWRTIGTGHVWRGDIRNQKKDGSYYWVDTTIVPFLNEKGKPYQYVSIRYEITKRKEAEATINHLAYNDQLTNLPNRLQFRRELYDAVQQAQMRNEKVCAIRLDVDRLRNINDSLGFETGDYVLSIVARRLEYSLPSGCMIASIGGDQFGVILRNQGEVERVEEIVKTVIEDIEQPIELAGEHYTISVSVGISFYPDYAQNGAELSTTSEKALLEMKEKGGGGYQFYKPQTVKKSIERIVLENELRNSIRLNYFHLDYQPQFDLETGRITGVEALVRWVHPDLGRIPPNEFIHIAEETRLMIPLGEWILREAFQQSKEWSDKGYHYTMAVNVSVTQLNDEDFLDTVKHLLDEIGNDPSLLELELTESVFGNHEEMLEVIQEIRNLGIRIAIDDFGTGYSSFSYIKELPVDTLKIDRAFIRDIHKGEAHLAIIKAIISVGTTVGLNMVAEGIEEEEQLETLRELGCQIGQGYFYSKPTSASECEKFMRKTSVKLNK